MSSTRVLHQVHGLVHGWLSYPDERAAVNLATRVEPGRPLGLFPSQWTPHLEQDAGFLLDLLGGPNSLFTIYDADGVVGWSALRLLMHAHYLTAANTLASSGIITAGTAQLCRTLAADAIVSMFGGQAPTGHAIYTEQARLGRHASLIDETLTTYPFPLAARTYQLVTAAVARPASLRAGRAWLFPDFINGIPPLPYRLMQLPGSYVGIASFPANLREQWLLCCQRAGDERAILSHNPPPLGRFANNVPSLRQVWLEARDAAPTLVDSGRARRSTAASSSSAAAAAETVDAASSNSAVVAADRPAYLLPGEVAGSSFDVLPLRRPQRQVHITSQRVLIISPPLAGDGVPQQVHLSIPLALINNRGARVHVAGACVNSRFILMFGGGRARCSPRARSGTHHSPGGDLCWVRPIPDCVVRGECCH